MIRKNANSYKYLQGNTHYITNDETTPYSLISKNRIYNLDWLAEQFKDNEEEDTDESEE